MRIKMHFARFFVLFVILYVLAYHLHGYLPASGIGTLAAMAVLQIAYLTIHVRVIVARRQQTIARHGSWKLFTTLGLSVAFSLLAGIAISIGLQHESEMALLCGIAFLGVVAMVFHYVLPRAEWGLGKVLKGQ